MELKDILGEFFGSSCGARDVHGTGHLCNRPAGHPGEHARVYVHVFRAEPHRARIYGSAGQVAVEVDL